MFAPVLASLLAVVSLSAAQNVVTVQVGSTQNAQGGIFQFIPPTVTASNGTVVTFQFSGVPGNHSVTQSSFTDPCDPLEGGFDSGWVEELVQPSQMPEFNLTITDDTKPIWFFCKQLLPSPHCLVGMVGAINAPTSGNNTFANFQDNAKNHQGTPGQTQNGLVGIGASASAPPGPIGSGVTLFGATAAGTGAASGTGGASGTATSPGAGAPTTTSGAMSVVASPLVAFLAAAVGIVLA